MLFRIYIILSIFVLLWIGWFRINRKLKRFSDKQDFAGQFLEKFRIYFKSQGQDGDSYGWMIFNSVKMQRELGSLGLMSGFRPAGANYIIN